MSKITPPRPRRSDSARRAARRRRDALRAAAHKRVSSRADECVLRSDDDAEPAPGQRSVFISYSRRDEAQVSAFVECLRRAGILVVWDRDFPSGRIDKLIREAIDAAACVIVVWSAASSESLWVDGEATRALKARKLVSTHLEGFDLDRLSLVFSGQNSIPVADLARIAGSLAQHGVDIARLQEKVCV